MASPTGFEPVALRLGIPILGPLAISFDVTLLLKYHIINKLEVTQILGTSRVCTGFLT